MTTPPAKVGRRAFIAGDVHRLCVELGEAATADGNGVLSARARGRVLRLASELEVLTSPHFDIEEATLTTEHLASLLTARESIALFNDIREQWNSR